RLTSANIGIEISKQKQIVDAAIAERDRLLARAQQRIPQAESTKAQAGAAEADAKRIDAQTKIIALEAKQKEQIVARDQALAEATKQQVDDIKQLEIEYGKLKGNIEAALNAATDEKFSKQLLQLGRD